MKKAFTLIELILIIIIAGVIASIAFSTLNNDHIYQGVNQLESHMRYTQHLALQYDPYDPTDENWFKKRFQIIFIKDADQWTYTICAGCDKNTNGKIATDPQNKDKLLSGGHVNGILQKNISKKMKLKDSFGIEDVQFTNCDGVGASEASFTFDKQGRVLIGSVANYNLPYESRKILNTTCEISVISGDKSVRILLEPESGYIHRAI